MLILMNLAQDLDELITGHLTALGYRSGEKDTPIHKFCIWFEHSERLIPIVPHQIELSKELLANPKFEVLKPVITEISDRIRLGMDVKPYLSGGVSRIGKKGRDRLLIHWGIHHLHLKSLATIKPNGLVARADDLLFFRIHNKSVYFIDILAHDEDVFEQKKLLEIVDRNWPHLHVQINGMQTELERTPEDIKILRRNNLTHMEQVNGRLIMPTTGASAAGTPDEATLSFNRHQRELRWLEHKIRRHFLEYFPMCAWQWMAHIRLSGIWEKGFDIYETSINQPLRIQLQT